MTALTALCQAVGCATLRILRAIASSDIDNLRGFSSLRTENQQTGRPSALVKVRLVSR